jgi:hypothetical protein
MTTGLREPNAQPTPVGALSFRIKTALLQSKRMAENLFSRQPRHPKGESLLDKSLLAESRSKLWAHTAGAEKQLEAGKVHNLRIALRKLNGLEVSANKVFSFWRQVGRPSRWRGFVDGRELREGCIIPSTGGGLCQLSNALYDAALDADFEIIERHAHTQIIPGSLAEIGRDATVFWNYVDLRFKATRAFRIEAFMTGDELIVRLVGARARKPVLTVQSTHRASPVNEPNSCASCDAQSCFRYIEREPITTRFGRAAFLVDEYWPEFDQYIHNQHRDTDLLGLPLDGKKYNKPNYAWATDGFQRVSEQRLMTARRALQSRKLSAQGAARQLSLLQYDERLAHRYASLLSYDVTHVTAMQNLLPFLWQEGCLNGRTFDVLMTRLPMNQLHARLDLACSLHPESATLGDFRADARLVRAEHEALQRARRIITPHTEIAALFPEQAMLIDWQLSTMTHTHVKGSKVAFPASTVGRKGAYEMREVARALELEMVLFGSQLEGGEFWRGINTTFRRFNAHWLDEVGLVVLPAFVENRPRKLLEAIACGVPVIASTACGLGQLAGVMEVPVGNAPVLHDAVQTISLQIVAATVSSVI